MTLKNTVGDFSTQQKLLEARSSMKNRPVSHPEGYTLFHGQVHEINGEILRRTVSGRTSIRKLKHETN